MAKKFLLFGVLGWCAEILWTGFGSLLAGDVSLTARTYLWMFPIYGLTAAAEPLFWQMRRYCSVWQRAGVYALGIFTVEYLTGWLLQLLTGACPWDYGERFFSVSGFIRLDYAPLWAVLGLLFEQVFILLAAVKEEMG